MNSAGLLVFDGLAMLAPGVVWVAAVGVCTELGVVSSRGSVIGSQLGAVVFVVVEVHGGNGLGLGGFDERVLHRANDADQVGAVVIAPAKR
jgi:hypothetical protein